MILELMVNSQPLRSNRTLLELKCYYLALQKSGELFQSYLAGIEIGEKIMSYAPYAGSNRTLLELKYSAFFI